MPEMPSADMRTMAKMSPPGVPVKGPEFNISSKDVEDLVLEIKENLRLSSATTTIKPMACSHLSRKSSRASPYRIPSKFYCCDASTSDSQCIVCRRNKRKQHNSNPEDPYELLQKLLSNGNLVSEAVRRLQLGLSPKQGFYYDSE